MTGNLLARQGVCACKLPGSAPLTSHHCAPSALLFAIQRFIEETDRPRGDDDFAVLVNDSEHVVDNPSLASIRSREINWSFSSDSKRARTSSNDGSKRKADHFRGKDHKHCL